MYALSSFSSKGVFLVVGLEKAQLNDLMKKVSETKDQFAFEILFDHFAPKIKALMLRQGASWDQAEEMMQEAMMNVWHKAAQFNPDRGSLAAWIFTIARNKRIDVLRKQGSRHYVDVDEFDVEDEDADTEIPVLTNERVALVSAALKELPEDQKKIITLSYIDDLSQVEIAEKENIPLGTVKSRMRLAYQKLKPRLEGVL